MSILSKIKSLFVKEDNTLLQQTNQEETKEQEKLENQQEDLSNETTYTLNKKQFEELCEKIYVKVEARVLELLNTNRIEKTEPAIFISNFNYVEEDSENDVR